MQALHTHSFLTTAKYLLRQRYLYRNVNVSYSSKLSSEYRSDSGSGSINCYSTFLIPSCKRDNIHQSHDFFAYYWNDSKWIIGQRRFHTQKSIPIFHNYPRQHRPFSTDNDPNTSTSGSRTKNGSVIPEIKRAKQLLQHLKDRAKSKKKKKKKNHYSHLTTVGEINDAIIQLSRIQLPTSSTSLTALRRSSTISPNSITNVPSIHAHSHIHANVRVEASQIAQLLLEEMETSDFLRPDIITYNSVLNCWAKSSSSSISSSSSHRGAGRESAEKAEQLLNRMLKEQQHTKTSISAPDIISFNTVLEAWAKSEDKDAGIHAERILSQMMEFEHSYSVKFQKQLDTSPEIMASCWANVLNAWANAQNAHNAAERATHILDEMVQRYETSKDVSMKPNTFAYNAVIKAWARSGKKGLAARNAEAILRKMEQEMFQYGQDFTSLAPFQKQRELFPSKTDFTTATPTTATYNFVLDAWAKSGEPNSTQKVEEILLRMLEIYKNGLYDSIRPNCYSFTIAITALAKSSNQNDGPNGRYTRKNKASSNHSNAMRAEALLNQMLELYKQTKDEALKPSTASFNAVIDIWSKCSNRISAMKTEEILNQLETVGRTAPIFDIQPDTITYTSVITAWARSGDRSAGYRAEALLQRMEHKRIKANIITYSAVIDAWAKSRTKHSAAKAEAILDRMESSGITPNLISFNTAISAWSKSNDKDTSQRIEVLLQRMQDYVSKGHSELQPDTITWNAVIHSYSRADSKDSSVLYKVENILKQMENQYKDGNKKVKPTCVTYTTLMDVYAKTSLPNKAMHAEGIFYRMINLHETTRDISMRPTLYSYSVLLNACDNIQCDDEKAMAEEKKQVWSIALRTFQKLDQCKYLQMSPYIYIKMINFCGTLLPDDDNNQQERTRYLETLFSRCCNEGNCNNLVLRAFYRATVTRNDCKLWERCTGMSSNVNYKELTVKNLPSTWSSSTKEKIQK